MEEHSLMANGSKTHAQRLKAKMDRNTETKCVFELLKLDY